MRYEKIVPLVTAVLISGGFGAGMASADQLGKDACAALKAEAATLDATGLKDEMEKGPDWAKANMAPDRLSQVARYIEIEEQISFRCRVLTVPPRRKSPPVAKSQAGKDAKVEPVTATPDATGTPAAKPAAKRSPQAVAPGTKVKKPQAKTGLFSIE